METDLTTLREAQTEGTIDQFVKEHRGQPKGDAALFNATLASMAGTSKEVPEASCEASDGD